MKVRDFDDVHTQTTYLGESHTTYLAYTSFKHLLRLQSLY